MLMAIQCKLVRRRIRLAGLVLASVPLAGAIAPTMQAQVFPAPAQASPITRVRPQSTVNRLLDALEEESVQNRWRDPWAMRIKGLVEQGPDAVPDLIAELDATDNDMMLRTLGFVLRAIGDKRAVPALIRALPKTLRKPGSDMGLRAEDRDLLAFMQKHDLDKEDRGGMYSFGRPVREIGGALAKLTDSSHREEELYHTFLSGSPRQQQMQRRLFHDCAQRWAAWWEANWKEYVSDAAYAVVNLPRREELPITVFPHGPGIKMGPGGGGHTAEADTDENPRREVFYDFDTGRMLGLPEQLRDLKDDPHRVDKTQAWAAREGFDLMGTFYQPAGSDKAYYAIRNLGMTAWEIDAERWERIGAELQQPVPPALDKPAGGLLLHYDEKQGTYDPQANAVFLFITREGAAGVLLVGVEVLDTNVKIGEPSRGEQAFNPVGFMKGRRFSFKIIEPVEEAK
jgi:hypothetical protein